MVKRVLSALFIFLLMLTVSLTAFAEEEAPTEEISTYNEEYEEPTVEEETPAVEETPTVEEETPTVEEETPTVEKETPTVEKETPTVEEEKPAVEKEKPAVEEKKSFVERMAGMTQIKNIRYSTGRGTVRIVVDISDKVERSVMTLDNPPRLVIDLKNAWLDSDVKKTIDLNSKVATQIRLGQFDKTTVRMVINSAAENKIFELEGGSAGRRLVIDLGTPEPEPAPAPKPKSDPQPDSKKKVEPDEKPVTVEEPPLRQSETPENIEDVPAGVPSLEPVEVDRPFELPPSMRDKEREKELEKERKELEKQRKELEKERREFEKQLEKERKEREKELEKERKELEKQRRELEKQQEKERKEREKRERKENKDDRDDKEDRDREKSDEPSDDNKPFSEEELYRRLRDMTSLDGKKICIDPGHGGNDSGAIGPTGVMEKTVTLRVSLMLEKMLKEVGADVIMTRHDDVEVSPKGKAASAVEELKARCEVANQAEVDIFISIHADSFTNPNARGSTGYYYSLGSPNSKRLADLIRKALIEQIKTPSRGTQPCNFYVVRNTDMPATLVELAFISNPEEEKLLNSKEGILKAALGILDGIEDYFG